MSSPTARRRQRSTRLTVAVLLLICAAVLVTVAFLGGLAWFQAFAAASSVVLGAAATRITHSELVQTRREAARDRAEQAHDYRELTEQRTAENLAFTRAVQARSEQQELALTELEAALGEAQRRAADTLRRLHAETRRAQVAEQEGREVSARLEETEQHATAAAARVSELELEVEALRAELTAWESAPQRMHA